MEIVGGEGQACYGCLGGGVYEDCLWWRAALVSGKLRRAQNSTAPALPTGLVMSVQRGCHSLSLSLSALSATNYHSMLTTGTTDH